MENNELRFKFYFNDGATETVVINPSGGKDGITPHIGTNGNWYLGDEDTNVCAQGLKGDPGVGVNSILIEPRNNSDGDDESESGTSGGLYITNIVLTEETNYGEQEL